MTILLLDLLLNLKYVFWTKTMTLFILCLNKCELSSYNYLTSNQLRRLLSMSLLSTLSTLLSSSFEFSIKRLGKEFIFGSHKTIVRAFDIQKTSSIMGTFSAFSSLFPSQESFNESF
jgi:hypothetical protein